MKKRSAIIIAIILMSIGFAAVSTTLVINGNAKVSENNEDFSVIFTAASLDGKDVYSSIVNDTKKTISFITPELSKEGDNTVLTYEVTNNSNQYDAEVNVTCVPKGGTTAKYTSIKNKLDNDATIVKAKESIKGTLTVTLDKTPTEEVTEEYTCKLEFNAVERENIGYNGPTEWTFDYTGGEQIFTVPVSGTYKLEVWGAQGGYVKGTINSDEAYGGYSVGNIILSKDTNLYIQVGGMGLSYDNNKLEVSTGNGYNGGGISSYQISSANNYFYGSGGGGATHIATVSGLLASLNKSIDKIIIVSGGGGGSSTSSLKVNNNTTDGIGGSGGGHIGNNGSMLLTYPSELLNKFDDDRWYGTGGNQTFGGDSQSTHSLSQLINASFGRGCTPTNSLFSSYMRVSGGGGFYGGGCGTHSGGGGGSGYIGNSLLTEKSMYCYNCQESSEESTKTISTTCTSATSTENCAKQGNGYARITLIK